MWITVALVAIGGLTVLYLWTKKRFQYFAERGIPHEPGTFPYGCSVNLDMLLGRVSFMKMLDSTYKRFRGVPVVGYFGLLGDGSLMVQDMELIKDVMIKDFNHFVDRRTMDMGSSPYMQNTILTLNGDKWKAMRSKVSPVFTGGKLKSLAPLVQKVGHRLVDHLKMFADKGLELEAKEMMTKFSTDVVGSTGFGIEVNSFDDPNSIFQDNVERLLRTGKHKSSYLQMIAMLMSFFLPLPWLTKVLGFDIMDRKAVNFFAGIIKQQLEDRKRNPMSRNDFIDIMTHTMQQHAKGTGDEEQQELTEEEIEMSIVSNAFLLFIAGLDTSSTGTAVTVYCLAKNPEVQEKLHMEIRKVIEENEQQQNLDYDQLQHLPYLEMCINEALRYYPASDLERKCVKDYKFNETNITVPKGMLVMVPAVNLMKDEKYFPNPNEYNPENFSRESMAERGPYPFMVFGHGPRKCVGQRFAMLMMKTALFHLVANYKILPCSKTVDSLDPDPMSQSALPKVGMWVKVEKREA